ncbi:response regulator [Trichloromonas sp.]|uniref:GAF domain-containing sensor histidine kinase n=1 Tax=Trichloromonas sp. TaxID=3069249 RepID=UPI003D8134F5
MPPELTAGPVSPDLLIVDDAPFFRRFLGDFLESHGYRVLQAGSGLEAIDIITREPVAAVLTDIEMPGMAGPELLRNIKRRRPEIPVVMISSHHDFEAAREVLRDGALEYLTKPLQEQELLAAVERALEENRRALAARSLAREAQRRLSDLVLLKKIGHTASSEGNLSSLLEKVLDSIVTFLSVNRALVMLAGDDGGLRVAASRGVDETAAGDLALASGLGICGQVLLTGEPVLVDDLASDPRYPLAEAADRFDDQPLLAVPMRSRDQVIGVLYVSDKHTREPFGANDRDLLATIAHQTSLAIDNLQLVSILRERARELEQVNRSLLKLNQDRSRLVSSLSHELNTPLTSILGYVDLILNFPDQIDAAEVQGFLKNVLQEGQHMEKLIGGMLQLFSIDTGTQGWQGVPLALAELLAAALAEREPEVDAKGVTVGLELAEGLHPVRGDSREMPVLLHALLENAVKFNRPGGRILIRAENSAHDENPSVYLQIHNDGRSVPLDAGSDIFDGYVQLGDIDSDKPEGVGVGLATCRAIVRRMGGEIVLVPSCGEGTTFGLQLPAWNTNGE